MRVLIIDNYDSFTYNLVHYLEALNCDVTVIRNDVITYDVIADFHKIILSPGSGLPDDAGLLTCFIRRQAKKKSILGICLGQQAIAEVFGGKLEALEKVRHGESNTITHYGNDPIYKDIPKNIAVGLYFSWHTTNLPEEIIPTAVNAEGVVMSLKHRDYDIRSLQYHPESIMTPMGKKILQNWLNIPS